MATQLKQTDYCCIINPLRENIWRIQLSTTSSLLLFSIRFKIHGQNCKVGQAHKFPFSPVENATNFNKAENLSQ